MSDEPAVTNGIDRAFDFAEKFVEGVGSMIGVDVNADDRDKANAVLANGAKAMPAASAQRALPATTGAASGGNARDFEIIEVKGVGWIVTNGTESAKCDSRAFADQLLAAIRSKRP